MIWLRPSVDLTPRDSGSRGQALSIVTRAETSCVVYPALMMGAQPSSVLVPAGTVGFGRAKHSDPRVRDVWCRRVGGDEERCGELNDRRDCRRSPQVRLEADSTTVPKQRTASRPRSPTVLRMSSKHRPEDVPGLRRVLLGQHGDWLRGSLPQDGVAPPILGTNVILTECDSPRPDRDQGDDRRRGHWHPRVTRVQAGSTPTSSRSMTRSANFSRR